jgi:MSHA biogenesis protein MshK
VVRLSLSLIFGLLSAISFAQTDPTAPLGWQEPKREIVKKTDRYPLPELQSIICRDDAPCYAILSNKIVENGQTVSGYYVKSVEKERVVLTRAGKHWSLSMFNADIKK